jgi:hypothetical protein
VPDATRRDDPAGDGGGVADGEPPALAGRVESSRPDTFFLSSPHRGEGRMTRNHRMPVSGVPSHFPVPSPKGKTARDPGGRRLTSGLQAEPDTTDDRPDPHDGQTDHHPGSIRHVVGREQDDRHDSQSDGMLTSNACRRSFIIA